MARTALTLRIGAPERDALRRRPINQLLIEAIGTYLRQKGRRERTLEANLKTLREYRRKDPWFKRAIAAFVAGEASQKDPLEGEAVESDTEHSSRPMGELVEQTAKGDRWPTGMSTVQAPPKPMETR
jgi:hypothetical protein